MITVNHRASFKLTRSASRHEGEGQRWPLIFILASICMLVAIRQGHADDPLSVAADGKVTISSALTVQGTATVTKGFRVGANKFVVTNEGVEIANGTLMLGGTSFGAPHIAANARVNNGAWELVDKAKGAVAMGFYHAAKPTDSVTARSTESATATAAAPVAISGSDVAVASSRIPTKARLIPVRSASASPERASH